MKLYFARHGESVANTQGIISNRDLPHSLTDKGRQQVESLAQKLQHASIAKIFTSPILRAKQTAEIVSPALNIDYEIAPALREFDCGFLEGQSIQNHIDAYAQLFDAWRAGKWESRFDGGESLADMRARFVPLVEHLIQASHVNDNYVLISHGGVMLACLPFVLTNIDHPFALNQPLENTAIVVAETTPLGLVCRSWGGQEL